MRSLLCILFCLLVAQASAQHVRVYAVALGNDSAGSFMGGSSLGTGLYQSDDTGRTWRHLGWQNIKGYSMDMVHASNGRILYIAAGNGVLRSTDYGEHWRLMTDWRIAEVTDVAINQRNPREIYISTAHYPWHSMDSGKTWKIDSAGIRTPLAYRVRFDTSGYRKILLASEDGVWEKIFGGKWKLICETPQIRDIAQTDSDNWVAATSSGVFPFYTGPHGWDPYNTLRDTEFSYWSLATKRDNEGTFRAGGGSFGLRYGHSTDDATLDIPIKKVRNVASLVYAGKQLLKGTLGDGVFGGVESLPRLQIWTLKSFLVTP